MTGTFTAAIFCSIFMLIKIMFHLFCTFSMLLNIHSCILCLSFSYFSLYFLIFFFIFFYCYFSLSSCVVFVPVDVIKERLQVQMHTEAKGVGTGVGGDKGKGLPMYRGSYDALIQILRYEGMLCYVILLRNIILI